MISTIIYIYYYASNHQRVALEWSPKKRLVSRPALPALALGQLDRVRGRIFTPAHMHLCLAVTPKLGLHALAIEL